MRSVLLLLSFTTTIAFATSSSHPVAGRNLGHWRIGKAGANNGRMVRMRRQQDKGRTGIFSQVAQLAPAPAPSDAATTLSSIQSVIDSVASSTASIPFFSTQAGILAESSAVASSTSQAGSGGVFQTVAQVGSGAASASASNIVVSSSASSPPTSALSTAVAGAAGAFQTVTQLGASGTPTAKPTPNNGGFLGAGNFFSSTTSTSAIKGLLGGGNFFNSTTLGASSTSASAAATSAQTQGVTASLSFGTTITTAKSAASSVAEKGVSTSISSAVTGDPSSGIGIKVQSTGFVSGTQVTATPAAASSTTVASSSESIATTGTAGSTTSSAAATTTIPSSTTATAAPETISSSPIVSAAAQSVTSTPAAAFVLPGRQLQVLPIGLGVFAGVSVLALIIVGVVTYERKKYRKQFRDRKMREQVLEAGGFNGSDTDGGRMREARI